MNRGSYELFWSNQPCMHKHSLSEENRTVYTHKHMDRMGTITWGKSKGKGDFLRYTNSTFSPLQSIPKTTVDSGGSCPTFKVSRGTFWLVGEQYWQFSERQIVNIQAVYISGPGCPF